MQKMPPFCWRMLMQKDATLLLMYADAKKATFLLTAHRKDGNLYICIYTFSIVSISIVSILFL